MRDSKEFRERFQRWKNGEKVYDAGRVVGYTGGKEAEYWDAVKDFVAQYEGFKDTTYLDGKGIPTIGYGFTDPTLTKRGKISRSEADKYFIDRLKKEDNILRDTLTNWDQLGTDAKKALISYRYNYPAGFKDTTNFIKYWNAGDYMNAIKEVDAGWNDTANPGLRTRRMAEQELLRSDPFLSGKVNASVPIEDPASLTFSRPAPPLDFTAPRVSTDVNQPFRRVAADNQVNNTAGWKALNHFETLDILKDLDKGYNWKLPKLPPLFPLDANQWTKSLIGYRGGKDGEEVYHPYNDLDKGYKYAPNTEFSDFIKYKLPVLNYIQRYINSKSFADKYQSHFNRSLRFPIDIDNVNVNYISDSSQDAMNLDRNGYYKSPNEIKIGTNWAGNEYGRVIAHEVGHAIDDHIAYPNDNAMVGDDATYSDTYKIFHKNKQIERDLKALKEAYREQPNMFITPMDEALKYSKRFPNSLSHDAQPRESYGDLMEFRWELYNNGIYDSTLNTPAKMEHIKKYKDSVKYKNRLFKYYSDEDILNMLNTVAQNTTNNNNELLYAKRGKDSLPCYTTGEDGGFLNWLKNALIGASVADAPAVATASGWHNEDGQWRQNRTAADEDLGRRLVDISMMSPTNPATAALDGAFRLAAKGVKLALPGVKQALYKIHPRVKQNTIDIPEFNFDFPQDNLPELSYDASIDDIIQYAADNNTAIDFPTHPELLSKWKSEAINAERRAMDFYKNDVIPRTKNVQDFWIRDFGEIDKPNMNVYYNKFEEYPHDPFHTFAVQHSPKKIIDIGKNESKYLGFANQDGITIIKQKDWLKDLDDTIVHEGEHAQRYNIGIDALISKNRQINDPATRKMINTLAKSGKVSTVEYAYSPSEIRALDDAYQFTSDFLKENKIHQIAEKGATNRELRYKISKMNNYAVGSDLDAIIDKMSTKDIISLLENGNGYSRNFLQKINNQIDNLVTYNKYSREDAYKEIWNKYRFNIKRALKTVPVGAGVAATTKKQQK